MVGKIQIKTNRSVEEMQAYLKKNRVKLESTAAFGPSSSIDVYWSGIQNTDRFKFEADSGMPNPWIEKCSLKPENQGRNSTLRIVIQPATFVLFPLGFMIIALIYFLVSLGIRNYGQPEFLISMIVPTILVGIVFFIWVLMFRNLAKKIRPQIIDSFDTYITVL